MRASNELKLPVFKIYFKVLKKMIFSIIIYLVIFLVIATLVTKYGNTGSSVFKQTKSNVAFINYDGDTSLTNGLKDCLSDNATFVNIKDNSQALQDALYFRSVEYVIRIPKGFTQDFLSGKDAKISKTALSDSANGVYMDFMVNRYLNTVKLYKNSLPNLSDEQLIQRVKDNLSEKADVNLESYGASAGRLDTITNYFDELAYFFLCVLMLSISCVMMAFNKKDLMMRTMSSPLRPTSMSIQLFFGHVFLTLICWIASIVLGLVLCGTKVIGPNFALMCVNALCFAMVGLGISFFVGHFVKSYGALNGIVNAAALGMCFISGIFVPQELLADSVLKAAHFTPTFWYAKAMEDIKGLVNFDFSNLQPIIISMLIELGFAAAFFSLSLAASRHRKILS